MDIGTSVVDSAAPLSLPLWLAQLLVTFMFASGFINYYRRLWRWVVVTLKAKRAPQLLMRVVMMAAAIGIGTGLHMVGWTVFTNASGLMFHNMGLFVLTFVLLDTHIKIWEFLVRVAGLLDVWVMHHMGYYDRPQFLISLVGVVVGLAILWWWRNQIRYRPWRHIAIFLYFGVCFWTLLPPHSAGLTVTPEIVVQGLCMYLAMVIVTAVTLARDHQLDVQNATNAQLAHYDSLTNVKSNSVYRQDVTTLFHEAQTSDLKLALAALDIDHFKQINDHYGHLAGDDVLAGVAQVVAAELRRYDGQHSLYRTGGEEFTIVFADVPPAKVRDIVTSVWKTVQHRQFRAGDYMIRATLSIGVAEMKPTDRQFDDLYARADESLYQSKRNGRNAVTIGAHTLDTNGHRHVMATRTLISQNVVDVTNARHIIAQEVRVARYEYDRDRWNIPRQFTLPIDVQLNYIHDLLAAGDALRIMMPLTQLQLTNGQTLPRLLKFIAQEPLKPTLVLEVDHHVDFQALRQVSPRYHEHGIQIALTNLDAGMPLQPLAAYLPLVDILKLGCAGLRAQYPQGLSGERVAAWRKLLAGQDLTFVVCDIENSVDANFATKMMRAQYLQGYYFDRPELPRLV